LAGEFNACVQHYANSAYASSDIIAPSSTLLFTSPVMVPDGLPHALASIVAKLPPYHFYLLRALSSHLARVNNNSEINKMNISNLGLIFCPSLNIGSILLKAFVEHLDIVFGSQCQLEEQELLEEEQETLVKEKQATDIYQTTNTSEEFSRSIKDLLTFEEKAVQSSDHSLPSSFSSSYSSTNVKEDEIYSNTAQTTTNTKNAVKYGTFSTVRTRESLRAISSSPSLYSMQVKEVSPQPINGTNASNSFGGNKVLFSLSDVTNDNQNHNVNTAALVPEPSDHNNSSVNSFYRRRTRSAGARNVPLNLWDYSSSSATSSDDEGSTDDKTEEVEDASPKLMAFNYFDQSGVETLGVLNLSPRASHQWALHNNGVDGKKSTTTSAWLNRRPSLEEREHWKRTILTASSEEISNKNLDDNSDDMGSKIKEHGSLEPKDTIGVAHGLNGVECDGG
ncbi:6149_t:CDS:1, partial [Paraglomus occultum]